MLAVSTAALVGTAVPAGAATPTTFQDFRYASVSAPPSADKPQSKLWFQDGAWWGILLAAGGGVHVFELTGHTWRDTGTVVDTRSNSTGDALSDGNRLYVASRTASGALLVNRLSYDGGARTYRVDAGFPVTVASNGMESAAIAKDSTGVLWVTFTRAQAVWVAHSTTSDQAWTAPFRPPVPDTSISADDISAIVAFTGRVGVFWSNQNSGADRFAIHQDGAPDSAWSEETPLSGTRMADDHMSLRFSPSDPQGRVFAVAKTSRGDCSCDPRSDPAIVLLVRASNGTWTSTTFGTVADDHTRPQLEIDDANHQLLVFATAPTTPGGIIYYKATSMDSPSFASGRGTPFMSQSGVALNNPSTTKQPLTASTGVVALASDASGSRYYHAEMAVGAAPPPPPPTTDTIPPSVPGGVTASAPSPTQVNVTWQASNDNVGVAGYTVRRDGAVVGTTSSTAWTDTTAAPATTYSYTVDAFDAAGNHSLQSAPSTVTTPAQPPPPTGGGITLHGSSFAANPTATTLALPRPTGTAAGDVMLAVVADRGQPNVTAPAGWSQVRKDQNSTTMGQWVFWRVATSSDPSSFTFTLSSSQAAAGGILSYGGVNTSSPIDTSGGQSNAASTAVTAPSITTSNSNAVVVGFFGIAANTSITPPGGTTERGEIASTAGTFKVDSEAADFLQASAGATGSRTATAGGSAPSVGQLIALRPA